jgi:hypothetical protein
MTIHFEELWEKSELLYKDNLERDSVSSIVDEIMMKLNLYKVLEEKKEIPEEELKKVKSRTYGEILLTLTNLSMKDGINVFEALATAFKYRSIKQYSQKYEP